MISKPMLLVPYKLYDYLVQEKQYYPVPTEESDRPIPKKYHPTNKMPVLLNLCFTIIALIKLKKNDDLAIKYIFDIYNNTAQSHRITDDSMTDAKRKVINFIDNYNDIIDTVTISEEEHTDRFASKVNRLLNTLGSDQSVSLTIKQKANTDYIEFSTDIESLGDDDFINLKDYNNYPPKYRIKLMNYGRDNTRVKDALSILQESRLIEKTNTSNYTVYYKDGKPELNFYPNQYELTDRTKKLYQNSNRFFYSFRDNFVWHDSDGVKRRMSNHQGENQNKYSLGKIERHSFNEKSIYSFTTNKRYLEIINENHKPEQVVIENTSNRTQRRFEKWWKQILPVTEKYYSESKIFINKLQQLQQNRYFLARVQAYQDNVWTGQDKIDYLPPYPFYINYYPLASGRLQPDPHVLGSKKLRPYLRPVEDVELKHSRLFCLDYSKQELRLLTEFSQDPTLVRLSQEENFFDKLIKQVNATEYEEELEKMNVPERKYKQHKKAAMYAYIYGSEGHSLSQKLFKAYINQFDWDKHSKKQRDELLSEKGKIFHNAAKSFVETLINALPKVAELRENKSEAFKKHGYLEAPGGVRRYTHSDPAFKTMSHEDYFRRISLSHYIQGSGAYIARKIVIKSFDMQYSDLFLPIHDGFIFRTTAGFDEAIKEAGDMMMSAANEIVKIKMPVAEEFRAYYSCEKQATIIDWSAK